MLHIILTAMGKGPDDFDWVCDRHGHDGLHVVDTSKLGREFGLRSEHTDFEAGLREIITWYVKNRDWWEALKP